VNERPLSLDELEHDARTTLDDDGLDLLELVLEGWLPVTALDALARPGTRRLLLCDAENTVLALAESEDGVTTAVRTVRPAWRGAGPHWETDVRISAAAAAAAISGASSPMAYVVDAAPTRHEVDEAVAAVAGHDLVVVVVPSGRRDPAPGALGWAGLTLAAWELADAVEAAEPGRPVLRIALPWPSPTPARLDDTLHAVGVTSCAAVLDRRTDSTRAEIAAVPSALGDALDRLYLPHTAREVERGQRRVSPGAVVFFTGLSGSGKSTVARAVAHELAALAERHVTLLDGDEVRQHLSKGLGFDAAARAINIDRIGWVAALVASHGGIAVAAPIAPFDEGRRAARAMAERAGASFVLVHVSTPLEVCEARDRKGLYAKARRGEVPEFTGISSPYENPRDAEVTIDTSIVPLEQGVATVMAAVDSALHSARD
jgi:sulfate adenylyltransferase